MRSKTAQGLVLSVTAATGMFLGATQAHAGMTTINAPSGAEASVGQLLEHEYGGVFSASGSNLTNGTLTATRMDDSSDQVWSARLVYAEVVGRFAGYNQSFGIFSGSSGGSFQKLVDVVGDGFGATGSATGLSLPSAYRLARGGDGGIFTSSNVDNADHSDHMVTYQINGLNDSKATYMVFFEDATDFDFNDVSLELKTAVIQPPPQDRCHAVPLPGAAWMGLSTLASTGVVGGARRLRRKTA